MKKHLSGRKRRHRRVRKKIAGSQERPRLNVFRSNQHIYAQLVDDDAGRTVAFASSIAKNFSGPKGSGGRCEGAKLVGAMIAESAKTAGVEKVVFDRGGFPYHGRVKALAEAAREGGLVF